MSNLSSKIPRTKDINAAANIATITFVIGKNTRHAIKTPINIGIPPPLGIGLLCNIAGCLCFLGSSRTLYFLRKKIETGVATTQTKKDTKNGKKVKKVRFVIPKELRF